MEVTQNIIESLARDIYNKTVEIIQEETGVTLDRLCELAKADSEGRCVVSPCKIGETLYVKYDGGLYEARVQGISVSAEMRDTIIHFGGYPIVTAWGSEIGKTIFKSLKEAVVSTEGQEAKP